MRTGAGGFSLLEVLIAFTIMAMALAMLLQGLSGSGLVVTKAEEKTRLASLARSLLVQVGTVYRLEPTEKRGRWERYRWSIKIEPFQPDLPSEPPPFGLYRVVVELSGPEGRYRLTTLRIGPGGRQGRTPP